MVGQARVERATSTFSQSRSDSIELQARLSGGTRQEAVGRDAFDPAVCHCLLPTVFLAEATGVEPARDKRGDLANRCHTVRRRLRRNRGRRQSQSAGRSGIVCLLLLPPASCLLAGMPGVEPRKPDLEFGGLPVSLHPSSNFRLKVSDLRFGEISRKQSLADRKASESQRRLCCL